MLLAIPFLAKGKDSREIHAGCDARFPMKSTVVQGENAILIQRDGPKWREGLWNFGTSDLR